MTENSKPVETIRGTYRRLSDYRSDLIELLNLYLANEDQAFQTFHLWVALRKYTYSELDLLRTFLINEMRTFILKDKALTRKLKMHGHKEMPLSAYKQLIDNLLTEWAYNKKTKNASVVSTLLRMNSDVDKILNERNKSNDEIDEDFLAENHFGPLLLAAENYAKETEHIEQGKWKNLYTLAAFIDVLREEHILARNKTLLERYKYFAERYNCEMPISYRKPSKIADCRERSKAFVEAIKDRIESARKTLDKGKRS